MEHQAFEPAGLDHEKQPIISVQAQQVEMWRDRAIEMRACAETSGGQGLTERGRAGPNLEEVLKVGVH